jgi:hypothetical protein
MINKELILYKILQTNNRFKNLSGSEIQLKEKISILIDMGFIYEPYSKRFLNLFTDLSIKSDLLLYYDLSHLIELYQNHFKNYINKNSEIKSEDEIQKRINTKVSPLTIHLFVYSGLYGLIGFLLTLTLYYFKLENIYLLISILLVYMLVHFYTIRNYSLEKYEHPIHTSQFWRKTKYLFTIVNISSIVLFYFILTKFIKNYWIPIPIILIFREVYSIQVDKYLSKEYISDNYCYLFFENTNKVYSLQDFEDLKEAYNA